jgi:integrase/recombinase XerD
MELIRGRTLEQLLSPYSPHLMGQMMKRRLADAGLADLFSPHSFRVMVVTDLLNQNVPHEDVEYLAGHSNWSFRQGVRF